MKALAFLAMAIPAEGSESRARAIEAARAGDLAAFETVMRQYERMVLVSAVRLLGNMEDAKDAPRVFCSKGKRPLAPHASWRCDRFVIPLARCRRLNRS